MQGINHVCQLCEKVSRKKQRIKPNSLEEEELIQVLWGYQHRDAERQASDTHCVCDLLYRLNIVARN